MDLYHTLFVVPHTQGAHVWMTQFYLQITPYHHLITPSDCSLLLIYWPQRDERLSAEMTSCDRTPCNTQLTTNNSTSRTNSTVRSTQSTTSQVTATVVRDAIPECLAHVTLIVASDNLFLQWLVSAVRTKRRIAGQTGHATSIKQHLVQTYLLAVSYYSENQS